MGGVVVPSIGEGEKTLRQGVPEVARSTGGGGGEEERGVILHLYQKGSTHTGMVRVDFFSFPANHATIEWLSKVINKKKTTTIRQGGGRLLRPPNPCQKFHPIAGVRKT